MRYLVILLSLLTTEFYILSQESTNQVIMVILGGMSLGGLGYCLVQIFDGEGLIEILMISGSVGRKILRVMMRSMGGVRGIGGIVGRYKRMRKEREEIWEDVMKKKAELEKTERKILIERIGLKKKEGEVTGYDILRLVGRRNIWEVIEGIIKLSRVVRMIRGIRGIGGEDEGILPAGWVEVKEKYLKLRGGMIGLIIINILMGYRRMVNIGGIKVDIGSMSYKMYMVGVCISLSILLISVLEMFVGMIWGMKTSNEYRIMGRGRRGLYEKRGRMMMLRLILKGCLSIYIILLIKSYIKLKFGVLP